MLHKVVVILGLIGKVRTVEYNYYICNWGITYNYVMSMREYVFGSMARFLDIKCNAIGDEWLL